MSASFDDLAAAIDAAKFDHAAGFAAQLDALPTAGNRLEVLRETLGYALASKRGLLDVWLAHATPEAFDCPALRDGWDFFDLAPPVDRVLDRELRHFASAWRVEKPEAQAVELARLPALLARLEAAGAPIDRLEPRQNDGPSLPLVNAYVLEREKAALGALADAARAEAGQPAPEAPRARKRL